MPNLSIDMMVRYLPERPSPTQEIALGYRCKEILFGGRAGGGKSSCLLMAALQGIVVPRYSALLLRRTFRDLNLSGALMDRAHLWWDSTDAKWSEQNKTFTFPNGSRITFGHMENTVDMYNYQSAEYQFVGVDEAGQFEERQILYMLSRLRAAPDFPSRIPLRLFLCSNPGGVGHEFLQKRFRIPSDGSDAAIEQKNNDGKLLRVFIPSLPSQNPGLNVEEYTANLELLDPTTRDQLLHGKWIQDGSGLVYYCYSEDCNIPTLPTHIAKNEWHYVLGMDFGAMNDRTAFAVCAFTPFEHTIYLCWVEEHSHMHPSAAAKRYKELEEQFNAFDMIVGDCTPGYVSEMQQEFAIPVVAAERTHKVAFINLMNGALANGQLRVVDKFCKPWTSQALALQWADDKHLKERQSQHNDSCDAALYSYRACRHYSAQMRVDEEKFEDEYEEYLINKAREHQRSVW
jgi:hypothetical protein